MSVDSKPVKFPSTYDRNQMKNGTNQNVQNGDYNNKNVNLVSPANGAPTMDSNQDGSKQDGHVSCMDKVFSWRYAMVILLHLSFMMTTFARNCMPIALVCMTPTEEEKDQSANISLVNGTSRDVVIDEVFKEFSWDTGTQGLILSSASFLAFLAPLIANFIQPYFGHKNTLTAMTLVTVLTLFLTPIASRTSPWFLVCLRTILGATFGANVPAVGDSLARWAPTLEKQTMTTIVYTGLQTGSMLCSLLSGYLCLIPIDNGWPFIFYVIGAIICVWVVFWRLFCSINPEDHKQISEKELQYIKLHRAMKEPTNKGEIERPPYRTILTSTPVLAVLACLAFHYWSVTLVFTYMPLYIAKVLHFSVSETGVIMTCLSGARFLGMAVITAVVNRMMAQRKWSTTAVKKFNLTYGTLLSAVSYLPAILLGSDHRWIIIGFLGVTMFTQSTAASIFPAIPLDLAPRYAGFITGLSFSLGGLLSISAPLTAAGLTPDNTAEEWQKVWIVGAAAYVCVCIIFLFFGDCKIQPWAIENRENSPKVVSPFDPMTKSFAGAMTTSPVLAVEVSQVREMDLVVDQEITSPDVFTAENSSSAITHPAGRLGGESSTELHGVLNDGFEDEFDRSTLSLSNGNPQQIEEQNNAMDVRF